MRALTEDGVRFLQSDRARAALEHLGRAEALAGLEGLRKQGFSPDEAAWLIDQATLRRRAAGKLPQPERLLLLDQALEQASGLEVAGWRAARLRGRGRVLDLGAGIGGDTLALAAAGLEVLAVEQDPVRAALLRHNLAALGLEQRVQVRVEDWTTHGWEGERTAFADPARRQNGRRLLSLHAMIPPLADLQVLARSVAGVMAKVAPGLDREEVPAEAGLEFVSLRGELKEALLTWGELRRGPWPWAVVLPQGAELEGSQQPPARVAEPGAVLYEPDPAVLRAGLVRQLGARLDAWQLDPGLAFLSAAEARPTPFARCFRVLRQGPFGRKPLARWLRELGAGPLSIKRRGVPIDADGLARKLPRTKGGPALTVFLTRGPAGPLALVGEPLTA